MNNALEDLREEARQMPTIMPITQEIQLLHNLLNIDISILVNNENTLREILLLVEESHSGGTIFEVNDTNYLELTMEAQWLEDIATTSLSNKISEFVLNVAHTLRTRF